MEHIDSEAQLRSKISMSKERNHIFDMFIILPKEEVCKMRFLLQLLYLCLNRVQTFAQYWPLASTK